MAKAKIPKTSTAAAKKPRGASSPPAATAPADTKTMREAEPRQIRELSGDLHERIRARAYELWEQGGRRHDRAEEDWLRAEKEILGQHADQRGA